MDSSALRYVAALERADLRVLGFQTCAHLRLARHQRRLDRPGAGVDGPRRRQYDDALPAPEEPRRRRLLSPGHELEHRAGSEAEGEVHGDAMVSGTMAV